MFLYLLSLTISTLLMTSVFAAPEAKKTGDSDAYHMPFSEAAEGNAITNAVAVDAKASNFVEIQFTKGSVLLNNSEKTALNSVYNQARDEGKISQVLVLSWADDEYPSKNLKELSSIQKQIADMRNKSIAQYIKTLGNVNIETFNMAERPNTISKWFNTTNNRLKKAFTDAGLPTTADTDLYAASKASHSVILVKVE